jgi:uncharacterized membrane protein
LIFQEHCTSKAKKKIFAKIFQLHLPNTNYKKKKFSVVIPQKMMLQKTALFCIEVDYKSALLK